MFILAPILLRIYTLGTSLNSKSTIDLLNGAPEITNLVESVILLAFELKKKFSKYTLNTMMMCMWD